MSSSPNLNLPYILPQQAQKHVTANDAFRRLDALVQLSVKSASVSVEPASPTEGDAYILPAGASGASWALMSANSIAAFQDAQWFEFAPRNGWRAYVEDIDAFRFFGAGAWNIEGGAGGSNIFDQLGVNASPDATNRLSVKSDAVLFSHDDVTPGSGDALVKINKGAAADTASLIFQNSFSGRAELGLVGADNFALKVSSDGVTWKDSIVIDASSAFAGFGTNAPTDSLHIVAPTGGSVGGLTAEKEDGYLTFSFTEYSSTAIGTAPQLNVRRARGTKSAPAAVQANDWLGAMVFRGYSPAGAFEQRGVIAAIVDGAPSGSLVPVALQFQTGSSNYAERMRITSAGDIGVGVSAPSAKLDVDGAVRVKSYLKAALPSASQTGAGAIIYVSNELGGAVLAFSDGASWRRVTDRAVVS